MACILKLWPSAEYLPPLVLGSGDSAWETQMACLTFSESAVVLGGGQQTLQHCSESVAEREVMINIRT